MWIYTKNGYYSACANKDDPRMIHVRSQVREDLEYLREAAYSYSPTEITETPFGDYRFRLDIIREGWEYFLKKESEGIDYIKFKPSVKDKSPLRKEAYLTVFNEMMRFGRECAYADYKEEKEKNERY